MPMPRYNPAEARMQSSGAGEMATAKTHELLSNKLSQWEDLAFQKAGQEAERQGKQKAEEAFLNEGVNAKLNEEHTIYGDSYNRALESMQAKQISIDNSDNMQKLADMYNDDPTAFLDMSESLYKGAISEMPEHLKADFAIDFEANKASHLGKIRQKRKQLDDEALLATSNEFYDSQLNKATKASREGSYAMAFIEAEKAEESILGDVDADIITAEQGRKKIDAIYKGVADSKYKGINDRYIEENDIEGSQKHIDKFRKSKDALYSDKEREALADEMQSDLDRKIRSMKTEAKAKEKAVKDNSKIIISDAVKIYKSGKVPEGTEAIETAYGFVDPKLQHEYDVHKKAYEVSREFSDGSLQEQQARINSLEAETGANRVEKEVLDVMQSNLDEKFKMSKTDPMSLGVQDGLYKQTAETRPEMGMDALAQVLPERVKNQGMNIEHYGRGATFLFTETEAQAWSDWLESPATSEDEILSFIQTVEGNTDGKSGSVYNQLMKKGAGVFAMAGSAIKEGKSNVGMNIIRGQKILPSMDPEVITDVKEEFRSKIGNAFVNNVSSLDPALDSMLALYADEVNKKGIFDKSAKTKYMKKAINDLTNGIHNRNGQSFFLPQGVDDDGIDDWIDDLTQDSISEVSGMSKAEAIEVIKNGRLVSVGPGSYAVYMKNTNAVLKNPDGKTTFVLRYPR